MTVISTGIIKMVQEANAARISGDFDLAFDILTTVIREHPRLISALTIRAVTSIQRSDDHQAEKDLRSVLKIDSSHIYCLLELGHLLTRRRDYSGAHDCFHTVLEVRPDDAMTHLKLAEVQFHLGAPDSAFKSLIRSVTADPQRINAYVSINRHAMSLGNLSLLTRLSRWMTLINPLDDEALASTGLAMVDQTKSLPAHKHFKKACCLNPSNITAISGLAGLFSALSAPEEAIRLYERIRQLAPTSITLESPLMTLMHYAPELNLGVIKHVTCEAAKQSTESTPKLNPRHKQNQNERLRIGFLSFNFSNHPEGHLLRPFLLHHDKNAIKVFLYATGGKRDFVSEELKSYVDDWRDCQNTSDAELTNQIRNDDIDILIDLTGLVKGSNVGVLANRAAPIQVGWIGFFGTYGLDTMDYLIVDRQTVPPEMDRFFIENIWPIDDSYICYMPPDSIKDQRFDGPPVSNQIIFANFNKLAKTNNLMISVWSEILRRVPNGVLAFKSKWFLDEYTCISLQEAFDRNGIKPSQLRFDPAQGHIEHLMSYNSVDIALDPTPFGGGTTTLDTLWTGTPLVTLRGDRWAGRISASLLMLLGRDDLIAATLDEYVEIAVALAHDSGRRQELRVNIQKEFRASPAMNGPSFARKLEQIFREMVAAGAT